MSQVKASHLYRNALTTTYPGAQSRCPKRKQASVFFFEKKNQKTFACYPRMPDRSRITDKSFLVLFFKKEHACFTGFDQRALVYPPWDGEMLVRALWVMEGVRRGCAMTGAAVPLETPGLLRCARND